MAVYTVYIYIYIYIYIQWRLVAFVNGGSSKQIIEMSKTFIHRLPEFKGGINNVFAKNATFRPNFYLYK